MLRLHIRIQGKGRWHEWVCKERRKGEGGERNVQSNRSLPDFDFLSSGYPKIPPYNRVRWTSATILPIYHLINVSLRSDFV